MSQDFDVFYRAFVVELSQKVGQSVVLERLACGKDIPSGWVAIAVSRLEERGYIKSKSSNHRGPRAYVAVLPLEIIAEEVMRLEDEARSSTANPGTSQSIQGNNNIQVQGNNNQINIQNAGQHPSG